MKKLFWFLFTAALALNIAACVQPEPDVPDDINNITEDGFYVVGEATGQSEVTALLTMAAGINEAASQSLRAGMYEKYIVLQAGKEFNLAYVKGGKQEAYGATLAEFKADLSSEIYVDNPADAVFKGKLVIGSDAPKMKVATTGLYHIVLDLNNNKDLDDPQILLCPVTMGVRGGMNSWGFTELNATAPSNDGITFTVKDQELASGGEFKFAYNNAWKITLDKEGKVKANTNLGQGCQPGGDNIAVTEGAGKYDITLTYKLAAGDIKNSFSYEVKQTSASSAPTTMFMIGQQFGAWDWASEGVVELQGIPSAVGYFWCTRYFNKADGFKFCGTKAWNGDFTGAGTVGYTVSGGNCFVPEDGFYTVFINGNDNSVEIYPAEVWGIGDAWGSNAWDFGGDAVKFVAEGQTLSAVVVNNSSAVRLSSKIVPSAPIEGVTTGNGWIDWWKTEFVYFDGKIAYRGAGGDQERVAVNAGDKITIDFNNGTVTVGAAPASATIKDFAQEFVKVLDIWQNTTGDGIMYEGVAPVPNAHLIPLDSKITVAGKEYTTPDMWETAIRSYLLIRGYNGLDTENYGAGKIAALDGGAVTMSDTPVPETHNYAWGAGPCNETSGNGGHLVRVVDGKDVPCQVQVDILDNFAMRALNFQHGQTISNMCTYPRDPINNYKGSFSAMRGLITYAFFFKHMLDNNLEKGTDVAADVIIRSELFGDESAAPAAVAIKTADELVAWLAAPTEAATLEADVNLSGVKFAADTLKGVFDGKGHTVTLAINVGNDEKITEGDKTPENIGLFRVVDGTVKNLNTAGTITVNPESGSGAYFIGGVVAKGLDKCVIENCNSSVVITGETQISHRVGGVAGQVGIGSTVKNCKFTGSIKHIRPEYADGNSIQMGGIVAHVEESGLIEGCVNDGEIFYSALGTVRIGGICGYINVLSDFTFKNCTNNGHLASDFQWKSGYTYIGGISGYYGTPKADGKVTYDNCVNNGKVESICPANGCSRIGGIACYGGNSSNPANGNELLFKNCVNNGEVIAGGETSKKNPAGGIIGQGENSAKLVLVGCTANGKVTSNSNFAGGLIGQNGGTESSITDCIVTNNAVISIKTGTGVGLFAGQNGKYTTSITGKVQGGTIVKGTETIAVTADNFASLIVGAALGTGGSVDGVTFGN